MVSTTVGAKPARLTKNQKRRLKKKEKHGETSENQANGVADAGTRDNQVSTPDDVTVDYVSADFTDVAGFVGDGEAFEEFKRIFEKFTPAEALTTQRATDEGGANGEENASQAKNVDTSTHEDDSAAEPEVSRKKKKKLARMTVTDLKKQVKRPEVVEVHDVTSADPLTLVHLKAYRSTVPVPRHWCLKRRYLQGKRGIEKPPFELPEYIAATGITKLRETAREMDEKKKLKSKTRDRVQPKRGRIEIDYQVLHDAFFRYQTKPKLSKPGDLYFEGKEFEVKMTEKKPGYLSDTLKAALGMTDGTSPPPWLVNMQRYGPPPSYPNLKIPGLNAPIPSGASFGYHPGGWGKPPVNEFGIPLYGDVFGTSNALANEEVSLNVDKTLWGELESESEEEVESEEELDEVGAEAEASGVASGLATPLRDGIASITSGLDTPESIDLRKNSRSGAGLDTPITPATPITPMTPMTPSTPVDQPELYHVLQTQASSIGTNVLMGSSHTYVMPPVAAKPSEDEGESGVPESEDGDAEQEKKRKRAEKAASGAPVKKKSKDYKNVF